MERLFDKAGKLENHAPHHVLNTPKVLKTLSKEVSAYVFTGGAENVIMFAGFSDGLILKYEISKIIIEKNQRYLALIGHTNKINHMLIVGDQLYTAAQDCTVRQWGVANEQCTRVFKFQDPVLSQTFHPEHNFLFTGSWDKQVRAIDLKTSEIDRAFVASKDVIKCVHFHDKWLFVAGLDPIIRSYNLTTGEVTLFNGHTSWVLAMQGYQSLTDAGDVKYNWLFSASDDSSIRVWDLKTAQCLDELQGHKSGITAMSFINNQIFTGSYDHYVIVWSLPDIENKIRELQIMKAEDLRSKKFEAFESFMESKGKRKKPAKKKGKK